MATLALLTELAEVNIVTHMAGATFRSEFHLAGGAFMATGTIQLAMCAGERKFGGLVVIELPDVPAIRRMTTGAVLTEAAFVTILGLMTAVTIALGVLKLLREMALLARHRHMQTDQRKISEIVIKANVLTPTIGHVALLALRAKLTEVDVLGTMTTAARRA